MGIAKTTLLRYQDTLIRFGLIKNITRAKSTTGHYRNNIYQITPLEELIEPPDPDKIIDFLGSKMKPDRYQNDTSIGSKMKLSLVSKRYPNNTNLKHYQGNNNKEGEDAVAAVDFKKLKEKGEERMRVIRERMVELDFKEGFIEKILKEYSTKKIDEKLDLLMERRNIQRPAGWLMAALKNDYRGEEQERYDEEPAEESDNLKSRGTMHRALNESEQIDPSSTENTDIPEEVSREKAIKAIKLIQDNLSACISPIPSGNRIRVRGNKL
jgi:hypothetical protein